MSEPANHPSFEQSLGELERIVRDLEDGQTGLEEALARYETGIGLLRQCYGRLKDAEQRIALLANVDGAGQPVIQPFEHAASTDGVDDGDSPRLFR